MVRRRVQVVGLCIVDKEQLVYQTREHECPFGWREPQGERAPEEIECWALAHIFKMDQIAGKTIDSFVENASERDVGQ